MTTIDDDASMREEHFRETALKHRKPNGPVATGRCLYCNALLSFGDRWCNADCREDYELEIEANRRSRGRI